MATPPPLQHITVDGIERNFYAFRPATAAADSPVISLCHGGGGNAIKILFQTEMLEICQDLKFAIIVPEGRHYTPTPPFKPSAEALYWNTGQKDTMDVASPTPSNDIKFLATLYQALTPSFITAGRLIQAGASNGANMTLYVADQLASQINGFAAVACTTSPCNRHVGTLPVPGVIFQGEADPRISYNGDLDLTRSSGTAFGHTVNHWLVRNGLPAQPTSVLAMPDIDKSDNCTAKRYDWAGTYPFRVYRNKGGGHTIPGHRWPELSPDDLDDPPGEVCMDYETFTEVKEFFNTLYGWWDE